MKVIVSHEVLHITNLFVLLIESFIFLVDSRIQGDIKAKKVVLKEKRFSSVIRISSVIAGSISCCEASVSHLRYAQDLVPLDAGDTLESTHKHHPSDKRNKFLKFGSHIRSPRTSLDK